MAKSKSCFECKSTDTLADHHVVPKSLGGTNTVPLCSSCHGKVHNNSKMSHSALTKRIMDKMKLEGKRVGRVPYGYDLSQDGQYLVENKTGQLGIGIIVSARTDGMSCPKIAKMLNDLRVQPKYSDTWNQSSVRSVIMRQERISASSPSLSPCGKA